MIPRFIGPHRQIATGPVLDGSSSSTISRRLVMSVCETVGLLGRSLVQFPPFRFDPSGQLFFGWQSELIFAREHLIAQIS